MPLLRHPALVALLLLLPGALARAQTGAPDSAPAVPQRDLMDLFTRVLGREPKVVVDSHPPLVLSVLPAFSAFTGGHPVACGHEDRFAVCADGHIALVRAGRE